jgi:hypothetical protein
VVPTGYQAAEMGGIQKVSVQVTLFVDLIVIQAVASNLTNKV